jgi:hypothetical protein
VLKPKIDAASLFYSPRNKERDVRESHGTSSRSVSGRFPDIPRRFAPLSKPANRTAENDPHKYTNKLINNIYLTYNARERINKYDAATRQKFARAKQPRLTSSFQRESEEIERFALGRLMFARGSGRVSSFCRPSTPT